MFNKKSLLNTKVDAVEENLSYLSEAQKVKAKKARRAMQAVGTPTAMDSKAMLRMNLIKNADITADDANLVEKAYSKDAGAIKGKSNQYFFGAPVLSFAKFEVS